MAYTQNFVLEAWIKPANTTAGARVIATVGDQDSGYAIVQSGSALEVRFGTTAAAQVTHSGVSTSEWTYVALVRNTSELTFYVNNASVGTTTAVIPNWVSPIEYFGIGEQPRGPGGQNFVGKIDEVRYFTFAVGFDVSMLNNVTVIPVPAAEGSAAGWLAMLLVMRHRRRRA